MHPFRVHINHIQKLFFFTQVKSKIEDFYIVDFYSAYSRPVTKALLQSPVTRAADRIAPMNFSLLKKKNNSQNQDLEVVLNVFCISLCNTWQDKVWPGKSLLLWMHLKMMIVGALKSIYKIYFTLSCSWQL